MEGKVLHFSLDDAEGGMLFAEAAVHQKVDVRVEAERAARQRPNHPCGNSGVFQSSQGGNRARGGQGQPMSFPLRHQCFNTRCRHDLLTCPALRRTPYFRYAGRPLETITNYFIGEDRFASINSFMDTLGSETQPLPEDIGFGLMPRLTKVWWDRDKMSELRAYRQRFYKIINSGGTDRTV